MAVRIALASSSSRHKTPSEKGVSPSVYFGHLLLVDYPCIRIVSRHVHNRRGVPDEISTRLLGQTTICNFPVLCILVPAIMITVLYAGLDEVSVLLSAFRKQGADTHG